MRLINTMIAPMMPFTAEEVFQQIRSDGNPESVHLLDWPRANEEWLDDELEEKWKRLIGIRDEVLRVLEGLRAAKRIGNSLETEVFLYTSDEQTAGFLEGFGEELKSVFIVSDTEILRTPKEALADKEGWGRADDITIEVRMAKGNKCLRCWKYSMSVGENDEYQEVCGECAAILKKYFSAGQ